MSIDFRLRDYFHPVRILRFRRFLEESQWADPERVAGYQRERLRRILRHAYARIPYYRDLFDRLRLHPEDIAGPDDLNALPILSKADLRRHGDRLAVRDLGRHGAVRHRTSGTTGEPVTFYLDRPARVLEFCYYWRYWSWAGYRLGRPFAELGVHAFLARGLDAETRYSAATRKLDLNAARLSRATAGRFVRALERRRAAFLKGPPSGLHALAGLMHERGLETRLEAVFTTGETLLPHQRRAIEAAFHCPVLDSYGHMERTVGVSQCSDGGYHIHSEYGLLQVEKVDRLSSEEVTVGAIIGTSLHNLAMPLIRYRTGDLIEIVPGRARCSCGRTLPLCERILGRTQDVLVTGDGRYVTNAFVALNGIAGVSWFRIVQHEHDRYEIRVEAEEAFTRGEEEKLKAAFARLVGRARIDVDRVAAADPESGVGSKHRAVVSHVEKDLPE